MSVDCLDLSRFFIPPYGSLAARIECQLAGLDGLTLYCSTPYWEPGDGSDAGRWT